MSSLFSLSRQHYDNTAKFRTADTYDNEFRYYSKLVQDFIVMLSRQEDKEAVLPWIHKLSSPAYNVLKLRDKRNRYMLMLCISLLMDSLEGPFTLAPPEGVLPDIQKIQRSCLPPFEWEIDNIWEQQLNTLSEIENCETQQDICTLKGTVIFKKSNCPIHIRKCPQQFGDNKIIGDILDKQFQYLLWLCKPYTAMLLRSSDRLRAGKWIQALCAIDKTFCTLAKGIRNDYMLVLVGHISNQDLTGVFEEYPLDRLLPIGVLAQIRTEKKPITDPTHPKTAEFFMNVPHPDEGAFALIAVTGDLYEPKYK